VRDEGVGAGAAVTADHNLLAQLLGDLRERVGEHADVVCGVVRVRLPGPQHRGQALAGAAGAMVGEGQQRGEPEAALEGGLGALLL